MMKHICLPILCAACAFVSCVSRRVAEQTVVQRDSLEAVVRAKDSLIEVVFADINAVTENLARIRTRENLVALARNDEGVRRPIEEIDADIAAIDAGPIQSANIKGKDELIGAVIAFKTGSKSSAGSGKVGLMKLVAIGEKIGTNANARVFTFAVKLPKE